VSPLAWIELLAVVVFGTVGQLALKRAMSGKPSEQAVTSSALLKSKFLWIWVACYGVSTVLWLVVLRTAPLSQAFPVLGLQFALVPLASAALLDEKITSRQWLGVLLIVSGGALVGQS
jgi:undecaprenyl phosphate-alpha-L-ara4N flippase subunit ArnE